MKCFTYPQANIAQPAAQVAIGSEQADVLEGQPAIGVDDLHRFLRLAA